MCTDPSASIAFGRVVVYFSLFFVFALCEGKNEKQKIASTMLPQALGIHKGEYVSVKI